MKSVVTAEGDGRNMGQPRGTRNLAATVALTLLVGGGLAGCASSGPEALYGLNAPQIGTVTARPSGRQVLVPVPRALQALDTSAIAVADAGPVYTYFPKAAWADSLPKVVQAKIIETLEGTGRLRGVGVPGEGLLIDYQLQTELRAFELRVDGQDRAAIELMARLVNDRNGRTEASRVFRAEAPARGNSVDQAVEALDTAMAQLLTELARWVVTQI